MASNLVVREYLGNSVSFKMIDGEVYANATEMCSVFGKLPADWMRLKGTKDYIEALESDMGNHISLIEVKKGNSSSIEQGTWIHEKLTLDLARWLNVKFRIWCDEQIATLIRDGEVSIKKIDSYAIENPIDRAKRWIEEQEEKLALESEIKENKPFVEVAKNRIEQMGLLSLTDLTKSLGLKKGRITRWAKESGYLHKTKQEVNLAGDEYFRVYVASGFKTIGITESGVSLIHKNLEEIQ